MADFRGARGSNTGDDFHELWATRQAIRLLSNEEDLQAIAVEGLGFRDEAGMVRDTWDGVDCTQYFGGRDPSDAELVQIEQLKYSAANPRMPWTIARLTEGRRGRSIITRLAKAWRGLATRRFAASSVRVTLISNQPVDREVISAVRRAAVSPIAVRTRKPEATAAPEIRLAYATGLCAEDFRAFASALHFEAGAGSRFALDERVLRAIADWTDHDLQHVVTGLREFVRNRMFPESAGEVITRESVLLQLGVSEEAALFPCPSEISPTESPIGRAPVREAVDMLRSGFRCLCLHGRAGVGKTTALQEIEAALPEGSVMVKYDCYGGGRYLDPGALRHRPRDAFLQLTNELAVRLALPLMLSPHRDSDHPRVFANRLRYAASALAARHPEALLVIAVDASDNAIVAARNRVPEEASFVHDFVRMTVQPKNVRFVVTTRTGRLETLKLPPSYPTKEVEPFSREETGENVTRRWAAPDAWIDDFHHLSGGVPRVQAYAFEVDGAHPATALDRLRPDGKLLDDIFRQQFQRALTKSGTPTEVARLCAALITLPRPVPLPDLADILESTEAQLADICADLAPGIRLQGGAVGFADEDFEEFVRAEGEDEIARVRERAAEHLLSRASLDRYAALHVASALVAAGRGEDLLNLVEEEPAPISVADPVLRREAELQRLLLAIKVCREAGNVARALRFVLIGAEGIRTETALHQLLVDNPDLAVRFAPETTRRLILSDTDRVENRGPVLFQKLSVDADRGDAISVREGRRFLDAWLSARKHHCKAEGAHHRRVWEISISDISSMVEAALKVDGPAASLNALGAWTPKRIALEVALTLPYRLTAEGCGDDVEALVTGGHLGALGSFFLLVPLALSGRAIDVQHMARGLEQLRRRKLRVKQFFRSHHPLHGGASTHGQVLDTVLSACELLTVERTAPELVDELLEDFLDPRLRRIDRLHTHQTLELDLLFRAYALREARAGRAPDVRTVFESRPAPADERERRQRSWDTEQRDRDLMALTRAVFGAYATVASALVNRREDVELEAELGRAPGSLESESWMLSREHHADALRHRAAKNLLVLLAAGYAPQTVKRFVTLVHGRSRSGVQVPDEPFVARLSLWPSLHGPLLEDLADAASKARTMRIGADEKSRTLVSYARLMKPLSEADARETFNTAVEVADELDHEITAQIRLLDELVVRGGDRFANARATARKLGNIVADAAIRLEGSDHLPWKHAMSALARLDVPIALANAARWDDEAVAPLHETMTPVLTTALGEGTIEPEQAAGLAMLSDDGGEVMAEILKRSEQTGHPGLPALVEEAAWDILIRHEHRARREVVHCIERHGLTSPWTSSLRRHEQFRATQPDDSTADEEDDIHEDTEADEPPIAYDWTRETLTDSSSLQDAVRNLWDRLRTEHRFYRVSAMFESARKSVSPADRADHIAALAGIEGRTLAGQAVEAMLRAVDEWWVNPSVKAWCRRELPEIIVNRFPEITRFLGYGEDNLTPALERTCLADTEIRELLLRGLERHGDSLGAELIFRLAGKIGGTLSQSEAAGLADWYAGRLEERIPTEHRDQTAPYDALPQNGNEATARFLFAYLGDCDLRMRWRAAHAIRRLARTGGEATLAALVAEYHRREESVFRGRDFEFYWLAARLWFVLAWDRVASERPELAARAGPLLLEIALDDSFPHLLVRSFARDACEKLVAAGHLSLTSEESSRLACVNETPLARVPTAPNGRNTIGFGHRDGFAYNHEVRRFRFDTTDTLPYWYAPMLESFAAVDGDRFLRVAERWIIDVWGYGGDLRGSRREDRHDRFHGRDWMLSMNRHGTKPTIERLRTHLEWHAMWCTAGELLKSEALVPLDEDHWDELSARITREKLAEPPLWSADLLISTPLLARNFQSDQSPLDDWVPGIREADHRAEICPDDSPRHIVVEGSCERRTRDRMERTRISSALVEPVTGRSLLRALQTMGDSWDYKLPDEGEERVEISDPPYRLLGWLQRSERDESIDEKDPFRGYAFRIGTRPGQRVVTACSLTRDAAGRPRWSKPEAEPPMFAYEAWGTAGRDDEGYRASAGVAGHRLLVHREQLLSFLRGQELDLILEVEVTRHERESRRYAGEKADEAREGRFARLYLFDGKGNLEVAEGRIGTWTGDSPATRAG